MTNKNILLILIAALILFFMVFGGKSTADKYYQKLYSKQINEQREQMKADYESSISNLNAKLKQSTIELQASRMRIQDKDRVIKGYRADIDLIAAPEGIQDVIDRFGGLGYEAYVYNSL